MFKKVRKRLAHLIYAEKTKPKSEKEKEQEAIDEYKQKANYDRAEVSLLQEELVDQISKVKKNPEVFSTRMMLTLERLADYSEHLNKQQEYLNRLQAEFNERQGKIESNLTVSDSKGNSIGLADYISSEDFISKIKETKKLLQQSTKTPEIDKAVQTLDSVEKDLDDRNSLKQVYAYMKNHRMKKFKVSEVANIFNMNRQTAWRYCEQLVEDNFAKSKGERPKYYWVE